MPIEETPDIILASKTQSAETIQKILDGEYEDVQVASMTDQTEDPPPAEEKPPVEGAPSSSVPSEAGGNAGDDKRETPEGEGKSDPPEPAVEQQDQTGKKPGSARLKHRIQEKDAEIGKLTSRLEELERKLADNAGKPPEKPAATPEPKPEEKAPEPKPKPRLAAFVEALTPGDDYETAVEQFQDALLDWRDEQKQAQAKKPEAPAVEAAPDAEAVERWNSQVAEAKQVHEDWDEVASKDHGKMVSTPVMVAAVQMLDDGAELAYWLGTHPEEAHRIAKASLLPEKPTRAQIDKAFAIVYREFGKINLLAPAAGGEDIPEPASAAPSPEPPGTPASREARPAAAPVRPKAEPVKPLGSRGPSPRKRYPQDYSEDELRSLDIEDVRRLSGMETA
jgi:hypothetical protein